MKRKENNNTSSSHHGPPPLGRLPHAVLRRGGQPLPLPLLPRPLGLPRALAGPVLGPLERGPGERRGARERAQAPHVGRVGRRRRRCCSSTSSVSSSSSSSLSAPSLAPAVPSRDEEEGTVDEHHRVRRPLGRGGMLALEEGEESFLCCRCRRGFFPLPRRRRSCRRCRRRSGTDNDAPRRARDRRRDEARVVVAGPRAGPVVRDDERDHVVEEQARPGLGALARRRRRSGGRRRWSRR